MAWNTIQKKSYRQNQLVALKPMIKETDKFNKSGSKQTINDLQI